MASGPKHLQLSPKILFWNSWGKKADRKLNKPDLPGKQLVVVLFEGNT